MARVSADEPVYNDVFSNLERIRCPKCAALADQRKATTPIRKYDCETCAVVGLRRLPKSCSRNNALGIVRLKPIHKRVVRLQELVSVAEASQVAENGVEEHRLLIALELDAHSGVPGCVGPSATIQSII